MPFNAPEMIDSDLTPNLPGAGSVLTSASACSDWSTIEGGHHSQTGQSRMTINLTAAAPVLIGCPDHHANSSSAASTETTVTKAAKDDVRNDLGSCRLSLKG